MQLEIEVAGQVTEELRASANFAVNGFDVDQASQAPGSNIIPNTPGHTAKFTVSYEGRNGFDAWLGARVAPAYDWASGTWVGKIPPSQTLAGITITR